MRKRLLTSLIAAITILTFPLTAYANSSWTWLTQTTPLTVLPFAIILTLAVEIFAVIRFGHVQKHLMAAGIVVLANLASFILPLLFNWLVLYPMGPEGQTALNVFLDEVPFFIVGLGYLLLTLIVELPIVYCTLKNKTTQPSRLLLSILISNVITTTIIAVAERLLCVRSVG